MTDGAIGNITSWAPEYVPAGGREDGGILRFPDTVADPNVAFYRAIGGSHISERARVPFAMTALDTPALHARFDAIAPPIPDGAIVDVGGGDGRNALPWLERGYQRVIVIDAAGEALVRLRDRIAACDPRWLDRILLIESDMRALPLRSGCAATVLAIESLYYLNEAYETGLGECARILAPDGRMMLVERDREGALLMQLLYYGVDAMVRSDAEGAVWDGPDGSVRTRSFSESELLNVLARHGLHVYDIGGTSILALVLGWLNGRGELAGADGSAQAVRELLVRIGRCGRLRRTHVVVAGHDGARRERV